MDEEQIQEDIDDDAHGEEAKWGEGISFGPKICDRHVVEDDQQSRSEEEGQICGGFFEFHLHEGIAAIADNTQKIEHRLDGQDAADSDDDGHEDAEDALRQEAALGFQHVFGPNPLGKEDGEARGATHAEIKDDVVDRTRGIDRGY